MPENMHPAARNWLAIYGLLIAGLLAWMIDTSVERGHYINQVNVNTHRLDQLEQNGSPGVKPRLDNVEEGLKELREIDIQMSNRIDRLADEIRRSR